MWDTNGMGDVKFVEAVYTLPKALEKGAKYTLTMKMRTSADCAELGFWPIWNASANKNQWGGSDDVQYLAAYHVEAGDWKTLTWDSQPTSPWIPSSLYLANTVVHSILTIWCW